MLECTNDPRPPGGWLCSDTRLSEIMIKTLCVILAVCSPIPTHNIVATATVDTRTVKEVLAQASLEERKIIIKEMVGKTAETYNLNAGLLFKVLSCENGEFDTNLQSRMKYPYSVKSWGVAKGDRELSYGLAMIHLPSHPHITLEQATDPEFSIEYMGSEFAAGRASQWTCARKIQA